MQSSTCSKDTFYEVVCSQTAFVFDNPHKFGTSNGMLYLHSNTGHFLVEGFSFFRKFFYLLFLNRLYNRCFFKSTSLIFGVLVQRTGNRNFQTNKNKEKPLRNIRQRAILVYAEVTTVTILILTQIIIMGSLKIGKLMRKQNTSQASQSTETLGIIFMLVIIHAIKLHA